jgi:hypothetical protein
MATIVYLDAEDEITSAATRIRQADGKRVAIVIPFGSRVATSRINFKLLAREAMSNGRRLDIVAPDASARALAASAGLPVFASVGEYEAALDAPEPAAGQGRVAGAALAAGAAAGAAGPGAIAGGAPDDHAPTVGYAAAATARPGAADPRDRAAREAELDAIVHRSRELPVARPHRRGPRRGVVLGLLVVVVVLVAAGAAALVFLPAADITVTPRVELVGPIEATVRADPDATAVDEAAGVIPAQTLTVPVEVSADFPATGKRVEKTAASGGVRWTNCDPSSAYTIPKGTLVRTAGGRAYALDERVFVPVAIIDVNGGTANVKCQSSEVAVTAADPGPDGNVPAGSIRVIPAGYNRNLLRVTNPAATTGGKQEEFVRISKKDIEGALAKLREDLKAQFETQLDAPDGAPAEATVFPATAVLGDATPTVDTTTLVNKEVESFTLGLTAEGTVLAVDASPVKTIAETALKDAVKDGYRLVEGSVNVVVGEGTVTGGTVEFGVAGSAKQVRPVDGAALLPTVLGLTEADAKAALAPYGDVSISLWPGFTSTVPTFAQRVTMTVADPVDETPAVSPVPPTPEATEAPTDSAEPAESAEPLPSG